MHRDDVRFLGRQHVAVGEPRRAALAASAGIETFCAQPRLDPTQPGPIVPDQHGPATVERADAAERRPHVVQLVAALGAIHADDDLMEIVDVPQDLDDSGKGVVPEFVVQTRQDQRDGARLRVVSDGGLEAIEILEMSGRGGRAVRHENIRRLRGTQPVQSGDRAGLVEVGHGTEAGTPVGFVSTREFPRGQSGSRMEALRTPPVRGA
ncbi:MAG: hypothetical protein M5U32_10875 [Myxococcota bacterium]|nr:hypothetical protein [Myxococcota bacterium]